MSELKITLTTPELDRTATALEDIADAIIDPRFRGIPRIKIIKVQLDPYTFVEGDIAMITITDSQQFTITAQPVDRKGNLAPVDGPLTFTSSDPALLTVTPIDATSASVVAVGPLGAAQVVVTGDADLGAGVVPITGIEDVTIIAGQAVNLAVSSSAPTEQP